MQQEIVESYNQTELSKMDNKDRRRIKIEKYEYMPVKIVTAQSRATERWYTVRYVKIEDVKNWIKTNKPKKKKNQ